MADRDGLGPRTAVGLYLLAFIPFALLFTVTELRTAYAVALLTVCVLAYAGWSWFVLRRKPALATRLTAPTLFVTLAIAIGATVVLGWIPGTVTGVVHLVALAMLFIYYLFVVSLALYHRYGQPAADPSSQPTEFISIIVPAYNEAGYVGETVQALLDAEYPDDKREVIVVDDGSDDTTFEEASRVDSERVTVVRKRNGGKYSALNYGLLFASGDVIVTVDADSVVAPDALRRIVATLQADTDIGGVASQVKISNQSGLVTRCQRLEYAISTNLPRRMLDLFGTVTVVPGCLGAFRREALESVSAYDPDTLTEDFDLTIQLLKAGWSVRVSDALVTTEAPATWTDLYRQRLRWYRGNYMTIFKHSDLFTDSAYGALHRIAIPFRLVDMFVFPFAGWVIAGVIASMLLQGQTLLVVALLLVFFSIVVIIALLAIGVAGSDWRVAAVAPLLVVGYKQFQDVVVLKSLLDVVLGRELGWTRASRALQRNAPDPETPEAANSEN